MRWNDNLCGRQKNAWFLLFIHKISSSPIDLLLAGEDLEVGEKVLEKLVSEKQKVFNAESLLQKATDSSEYNDVWKKDQ